MHKSLIYLLCFLNLTVLYCAAEFKAEDFTSHQPYDLNALFARGLSRLHKRSSDVNNDFTNFLINFKSIDPDVEFQQRGNSSGITQCMADFWFILKNVNDKQLWALSVIDSFGKPGSGILNGNFKWPGDYDECLDVTSTNPNSVAGNFRGKYCSVTWFLPTVFEVSLTSPFTTGICVPDSCSVEELQHVLLLTHMGRDFLNHSRYDVNATITCKSTERPLNAPAKAVIALISIFCALTFLGSSITAANYFKKIFNESGRSSFIVNISETGQDVGVGNDVKSTMIELDGGVKLKDGASDNQTSGFQSKLYTFLGCFCVFTNGAKLLSTDSSEGQLLCIHGIRFFSMSWAILGHSYAFILDGGIRNQLEVLKMIDTFAFQAVLQGFYSVDSFFVLSGFLIAYLSMKEFANNKGGISWPYFYIHRYIRLTPIYMILLGFSATVYLYLGSGPFWPEPEGFVDAMCAERWWWNFLYINNFNNLSEQCMAWSWYLASDMQFFVISPLFLITFWRWPKIGYSLIGIFLCGTFLANFLITYHYDLTAGLTGVIGKLEFDDISQAMDKFNLYYDKVYSKPYTRIGPYLLGILTGYLFFKRKASSKPKHNLAFISIGWIAATAASLTCVYGLYHGHPGVVGSSFYNALNRNCFAAGLCWVIYVCLIGQGGIVNSILSYKLFIPLSRLSYATYLIHPMIISGYFAAMKTSFDFNHITVVVLYFGFMVISYGLALPVALILESPIVSLEKRVMKAFRRKETS